MLCDFMIDIMTQMMEGKNVIIKPVVLLAHSNY